MTKNEDAKQATWTRNGRTEGTVTLTQTGNTWTVEVASAKEDVVPSWTAQFPTLEAAKQAANAAYEGGRDLLEDDFQARLRAGITRRANCTKE
jgi:hypothetical protein